MKNKVYIAGYHVFLPKQLKEEHDRFVNELCEQYNLEAIIPKDGDVRVEDETMLHYLPSLIYNKNIRSIEECDAVIADITPFRGVSADAGTVFEIGYARAKNKPVIMFTLDRGLGGVRDYRERVLDWGYNVDKMAIEGFNLIDNLMITRQFDTIYTSLGDAIKATGLMFTDWRAKHVDIDTDILASRN